MSADQLNDLINHHFPDVAVDKGWARSIGVGERAIPAFVRDWLISRFTSDGKPDVPRIERFIQEHLPDKQQANSLKSRLLDGDTLTILDHYSVEVSLEQGRHVLKIPSLDIFNAYVHESIVREHPLVLLGSVWGAGKLVRRWDPDRPQRAQIWMDQFKPMQTSVVDIGYFIEQRKAFSVGQWRELLVRSMGYDPQAYTPEQQLWMIVRLVPLVQPRVNLIEFAPKGTGKSYVFSQLSKYAWLVSGGIVTRAQLFYNMSTKSSGVITKYDAVILDEVQTIRLSEEGEIIGGMKGYLESGEFRVMGFRGTADAGIVLLANVPMMSDGRPRDKVFFDALPSWLRGVESTALIDRFHGLVPGWELPRITKSCLARDMGLRADYLGEVLHLLRLREEYSTYVQEHLHTSGDLRDIRAVERIAAGLLRLLFPDLATATLDGFAEYCLAPAKQLRAAIRNQLALIDAEYHPGLAEIDVT
jgi:ATP-dependent Lon protease